MSAVCQKEYTITIASAVTPFAYYKCDDLAAPLMDQVALRDLSQFGGAFLSAPGKIGTAVDLDVGGYLAGVPADWNFAGLDFTVRLWLNTGAHPTFDFLFCEELGQWAFYYNQGGAHPNTFEFKVTQNNLTQISVYASFMLDANWNRIILRVKNGTEVAIKVNNSTTVTTTLTLPLANSSPLRGLRLWAQGNGFACLIDEIGIWKVALTEAQMLTDWNGGAGQSWP